MGPESAGDKPLPGRPISRRSVLAGVGVGAVAAGAGGVLSACSSSIKGANSGGSSTKSITIGWIHPLTGPLEFECRVLHIPDTGQRLIVYCAAPGSPTQAAFRRLGQLTPAPAPAG